MLIIPIRRCLEVYGSSPDVAIVGQASAFSSRNEGVGAGRVPATWGSGVAG